MEGPLSISRADTPPSIDPVISEKADDSELTESHEEVQHTNQSAFEHMSYNASRLYHDTLPTDIHLMSTANVNNSKVPESNLTAYCGIITPEIQRPFRRPTNPANRFECPRCGTRYTRAKTVQDAFPGCIRRYGNPLGLNWNSHPSCANTRVEPPRGKRLQMKKTRREKMAEKKNTAGEQIALGDTPVPESIEAQYVSVCLLSW